MRTVVMCLVVPVLAAALHSQSRQTEGDSRPVGVLLAAKSWKMGLTAIQTGDYLPPTATLTASGPGDLLLSCRNKGLLSYTCLRYPCNVPVCSTNVEDAKVKRMDKQMGSEAQAAPDFGEKLMGWLTRGSPPPITAGVREGGNPSDAVILADGDKLHLAPALTRVLEGDYCFSLSALGANGKPAPVRFRMNWNREEEPEGLVARKGIPAGAYTLEKEVGDASGSCTADPDAVAAWILIAPPNDFNRLTKQWKENRPWLDDLSKSGVSPAVIATTRHAILAGLSAGFSDASQ
jgi:hypothetical protein